MPAGKSRIRHAALPHHLFTAGNPPFRAKVAEPSTRFVLEPLPDRNINAQKRHSISMA
jgi:hypothetical protein